MTSPNVASSCAASARALTSWRLRSAGTASTSALWRPGVATNQARRLGRASGLLPDLRPTARLFDKTWRLPKNRKGPAVGGRELILSWAPFGLSNGYVGAGNERSARCPCLPTDPESAPTARADRTLNELAGRRRYEQLAVRAALAVFRVVLVASCRLRHF